MTSYARVITIGRNDNMPKVVRLPIGVGVDGCAITAPVTIMPDESVCPDCGGFGYNTYSGDDCAKCDGGGIVTIDDTESSAGDECLPPVRGGRPDVGPSSGRLHSSTSKVDARAAGDLRCFLNAGPKTHSHRSVSSIVTASQSPAEDMPPDALPGTLADRIVDGMTVVGGLAVFGMIAFVFLVIA